MSALLRMADRQAARALESGVVRRKGRRRNFMVQQHFTRLSPEALAELNKRLEDVAAFVAAHDEPAGANAISLTLLVSPWFTDRA